MKTTRLITATFVIALLIASLAPLSVRGQATNIVPFSLPSKLPIGVDEILEWGVTNTPSWLFIQLICIYTNGDTYGRQISKPCPIFNSYSSYQQFMMTNSLRIRDSLIREDIVNTNLPVELTVIISYARPDSDGTYGLPRYIGFGAITNMANLLQVTTNSVLNITPDYLWVVLWMNDLQMCSIQVDGLNTNSWNPVSGWSRDSSPYPSELATNGCLILNSWYLMGTNRARFTITDSNVTKIYTQDGNALAPPMMRIDRTGVSAFMSRGSDTTVESTMNFVSWSKEVSFPWSLHTNQAWMPITPSSPSRFYRAWSK